MSRQRVAKRGRAAGDGARERLLAGAPVAQRWLWLAGGSTAVLESGEGPSVVVLHGQGGFAGLWLSVVPGLATTHRVIAPDLPGLGASQAPDGPAGTDSVLAWLGELIDRTCPEPPGLVEPFALDCGEPRAVRVAAARHR